MTNADPTPSVDLAERKLAGLVRLLRDFGVSIPTPKHVDFLSSIAEVGIGDFEDLYWNGRVTLISRAEDLAVYDVVFRDWFADNVLSPPDLLDAEGDESETPAADHDDSALETIDLGEGSGRDASTDDLTTTRSFPAAADAERLTCARIAQAARAGLPQERMRRLRPSARGRTLDLRKVMRAAMRSGGEVMQLHYRAAPMRARRVLVLLDVSGSLKANSPDFLKFAHAVVAGAERAEVFTFGTRLTRITQSLRRDDVDDALRAVNDVVFDFDGGTRIGASIDGFLRSSRRRTMVRGAMVVVVSDGLERGDTQLMTAAVERLARLSHRVVWLTPLAGDPMYRPLTKAMAAIEPSLDRIGSSASLDDLLAEVLYLDQLSTQRRGACVRQTAYRLDTRTPFTATEQT